MTLLYLVVPSISLSLRRFSGQPGAALRAVNTPYALAGGIDTARVIIVTMRADIGEIIRQVSAEAAVDRRGAIAQTLALGNLAQAIPLGP